MATFEVGKTQETTVPTIVVDGNLPAGQYSFQLVVVDDQGQESSPVVTTVTVQPKK